MRKAAPIFEVDHVSKAAYLCCPSCGEAYGMHHTSVEVFSREEDADTGRHTTVCHDRIISDSDMESNPSKRRGGIIINLYCENCEDAVISLEIAQHKGVTMFQTTLVAE